MNKAEVYLYYIQIEAIEYKAKTKTSFSKHLCPVEVLMQADWLHKE